MLEVSVNRPLTRGVIVELKTRALRRRVWFRALSRVERGLVDLTIRWVDTVRSGRLARVLVRILEKLLQAMDERMAGVLERGRGLAFRASVLAVGWGNVSALEWRFDQGFLWALGLGVLWRG